MSTIFIEKRTREKLRSIGRKEQTYDDVINELIEAKEASKQSLVGSAKPTKQERT
jgi:predicted CopG family antitoxin